MFHPPVYSLFPIYDKLVIWFEMNLWFLFVKLSRKILALKLTIYGSCVLQQLSASLWIKFIFGNVFCGYSNCHQSWVEIFYINTLTFRLATTQSLSCSLDRGKNIHLYRMSKYPSFHEMNHSNMPLFTWLQLLSRSISCIDNKSVDEHDYCYKQMNE